MVSADDLGRSLRGTGGLVERRADALRHFDLTSGGFKRSFLALGLTAPAYVVALGLARRRLGLPLSDLFADPALALQLAAGHVLAFLAFPLAVASILRGGARAGRFGAWAIVQNWIAVFAGDALAVPGALYLLGIHSAPMAALLTVAFLAVLVQAQFFATRLTLGCGRITAAGIVLLGALLHLALGGLARALL